MSNADIRGRFVWHELLTTDTKAASAFYPKVTGWRTQPWDKDPSYQLWLSAKGPFGGVRTLPDAARSQGPSWLAYIGTPDVDATVQHAQKLGARVSMGATDIPDTGRMAVLADPQGAPFALFSAAAGSGAGSGSGGGPSDFSWHELTTTDVEAAKRFYSELFAWQEVNKHDMGPMGTYHLVGFAGAPQASIGMYQSPADKPMPTRWMCYAHVSDIDKSASAARSGGGKVLHGPMEVPGGTWIAHCTDPQGAAFAVHADKRVAASAPAAQPAKPATAAATPPKSPPPKPAAPAPKPPSPPTLNAPASTTAPTVKPPAPRPATSPAPSTLAPTPAPSPKPAAAPAAPAAKKAAAKKAPAKKAPGKAAKKASKKKVAAKRRGAHKKAKVAKKKARRAPAKRKVAKKRGKTSRRRTKGSGLAAARRVAVKQARSLLRRLRGKRHR